MRRIYFGIVALALLGALVIAGCGGGGSTTSSATTGGAGEEAEPASAPTSNTSRYGNSETSKPAAAESTGQAAVVKVMSTPDLGKVIVEENGMTLYDFHKDKGTTSACYGECAVAWPPLLTTGEPKATGGAKQSLLGTSKRKDGTLQVTYKGHPVYGFVEDKKPGETNGNDFKGFGAQWYALEPNGEEAPG